jgi:hypothetical protein
MRCAMGGFLSYFKRGILLLSCAPKSISFRRPAISAINRPVWGRLKGQLGYFGPAFRTCPIALDFRGPLEIIVARNIVYFFEHSFP